MSLESTPTAPSGVRGYWFRFFRVNVSKAKIVEQHVLKTDDNIPGQHPHLVEYTISALELPTGMSRDVMAAIDGRLDSVRDRVATFASSSAMLLESPTTAVIRVEWGSEHTLMSIMPKLERPAKRSGRLVWLRQDRLQHHHGSQCHHRLRQHHRCESMDRGCRRCASTCVCV